MPDQITGIDVSLEGISGCGKSYVLSRLREALQDVPITFIEEIEDRESAGLDQGIAALLRKSGDRFFRSGHPKTETLLLLALKAYDAETEIAPALAAGNIVLEDRGIDTIAIYQALVLHPFDPEQQLREANRLYDFATQWRQPPHITFLLEDEFATSLERAQQRAAHNYSAQEVALLRAAAFLYERYAEQERYRGRIIRLDRRVMDVETIVAAIREAVLAKHRGEG
jgi:dTMP kinase